VATAVQKIALSSLRDIPFNKPVLSQSNIRRVKAGVSVEELAEDTWFGESSMPGSTSIRERMINGFSLTGLTPEQVPSELSF
jgi:hypothetical protein